MKIIKILIFAFIVSDVVNGTFIIYDSLKLADNTGKDNDWFGQALAVNKDTIVVGSPGDDEIGKRSVGSISIYAINNNALKLKKKLTPSDGQSYDYFGTSVALNKQYIIVGSPNDDEPHVNQGSVYIYSYDGRTWTYEKIVADDGAVNDQFGRSVAINDNNELVVGAWYDDDKGRDTGSAYVFSYSGTEWIQQQKLVPSDLNIYSYFGYSVAITNTHITVGARGQKYNNLFDSGAIYIYKKNITWDKQIRVFSPNPKKSGLFGISVSMHDRRVVVGAERENTKGTRYTGCAYVYVTDGNTWRLEATLQASDRKFGDWFGISVSIDKQSIVIGASRTDDRGFDSGSAYVFGLINGNWKEIGKLIANDGKANDENGRSVGISNGKVVTGSHFINAKGGLDSGAAYLFNGLNFSTITTTPQETNKTG